VACLVAECQVVGCRVAECRVAECPVDLADFQEALAVAQGADFRALQAVVVVCRVVECPGVECPGVECRADQAAGCRAARVAEHWAVPVVLVVGSGPLADFRARETISTA
jgi:hypothetical protein